MRGHRERLDSGIGPPRGREPRLLAGHPLEGFLEHLLDRRTVLMPLPPHERPAVIFDRQPPPGHGRIVLTGIPKPRRSSVGFIAARPARCTRAGRIDPDPQAIAKSSSSTSPAGPD